MKQKRCMMHGIEAAVLWGDELIFEPHSHDEYVISTNVFGNETMVLDGKAMTAPEGATTLYNPGHVQGGRGTSLLVSIYLEPDFFQHHFDIEGLIDFEHPIVKSKKLALEMNSLISPIMNNCDNQILADKIIPILYGLCQDYTAKRLEIISGKNDKRVALIKEMLEDIFPNTPALSELAKLADVSIPTLTKLFVDETGLPPISWQRSKRLAQARSKLKRRQPISQVALDLGFADQAHMTRFFSRSFGVSPGKFSEIY